MAESKLGKRILVNGTFDILHTGHLMLLNYAKSLGDHLTVAIDTDERVKSKKGDSRPINNMFDRGYMLQNLRSVDEVKIFNTDEELITLIQSCDILVKGSDYKGKSVIGEKYAKQVIYYDRIPNYSTTKTIQDIIGR
jgi:D-beta-D-heptose 7-phosphate kinase/D-beta-D-heptose 1-phosphate adenosyltransferase